MQGYNLIAVLDRTGEKLLFCKRRKEPYSGLSNFVGGKIEPGETGLEAAYRELYEETSITEDDISLVHLLDFVYRLDDCTVEVYAGQLNRAVDVKGDENDLYWDAVEGDRFDMTKYAGEGNLGHIIEHIKMTKDRWEQ